MNVARTLKSASSDALYFSMQDFTDCASIRAWAGSYTPQGRSQCADATSGVVEASSSALIRVRSVMASPFDGRSLWCRHKPYFVTKVSDVPRLSFTEMDRLLE